MNEISESLSQGNIPILAIAGVLLLTISVFFGHGVVVAIRKLRADVTNNADWILLLIIFSLGFISASYWGWYFMTDGSM